MDQKEQNQLEALAAITPTPSTGGDRSVGSKINFQDAIVDDNNTLDRYTFHNVDRSIVPYEGIFYPTDWKIQVRAATTQEIKDWSAIDDQSPLSVADGITQILKSCVRFMKGDRKISYKNIKEHDRLFFVLLVRHYTFPSAEKSLTYKDEPHSCGTVNDVKLDFDTISHKPLSDRAKKYYNYDTCRFEIQTKNYGTLIFAPTSIYQSEALRDYVMEKARGKSDIDKVFAQTYWMYIPEGSEYNEDGKMIEKTYKIFKNIDSEQLGIYIQILGDFETVTLQELTYNCSNKECGKEVHTPIKFPNGIRNIFFATDLDSELV